MSEFMEHLDILSRATILLKHYIGRLIGLYRPKVIDVAILKAFCKELPVSAGEILARQMEEYNHYNHWQSKVGYEITFYCFRGFGLKKLNPKDRLRFSGNPVMSVASAKISAKSRHSGPSTRVDIIAFNGKYDCLRFDIPPVKIFGSNSPSADEIKISDIKILFDPMEPDPFPTSPCDDMASLPEWIRKRIAGCPDAFMYTPLPAHLRNKLIDYYDLPFAEDYLELVSTTEYVGCPHVFEIFGLSRLWMYLSPRDYVVILGEVFGEGYLSIKKNAPPGVYFIDHEWDHIPVFKGNSFEAALSRVLEEGADAIVDTAKEYNE